MTGKSQTYIMKSKNIFQEVIHTMLLLLAAFVWGMAFPFQSIGARYLSGWSFLAIRSWLSVIVMLPAVLIIERGKGHTKESRKTDILQVYAVESFCVWQAACSRSELRIRLLQRVDSSQHYM